MFNILPGNNWDEFLYDLIFIYLGLTLAYTIYSLIRMYIIEKRTNDVASGRARMLKLQKEGRYTQIPVYSMEEMSQDKNKEDVRLFCFPNDTGEKSKVLLILPGGGYAHCCTKEEGYPVAAALNEAGYTAFILEYRTGRKCTPFGPVEDVGRALQFIQMNQDKFNVTMENYAIIGFSAGGNLAAMFASHKYGYMDFNLPKPACVILGYPWTCVNDWLQHPYWNIWIGIMGIWLSNRGSIHMFGINHMIKGRAALDVQKYIAEDYPPVFMFSGSHDVLVPASRHADVFDECLDKYDVKHVYQKYFGLPHGIGLGKNTKAEKWLKEALEFWESNC